MPLIITDHFDAIRNQLQVFQKRDLGESARRSELLRAREEERISNQNRLRRFEAYAESRSEPPTDFTRALSLIESLRAQIQENPVSSLVKATANLNGNDGSREIFTRMVAPENAAQPR